MNQAKVEEMLEEVTTFLCSCGELPALKVVDDDFQRAEDRLTQELTRLFVRVENRIISELVSRGYIPTTPESRRVFVEEFLRVIADEFTEVLMEAAVSEQRRGRVITFQNLQNHGMQIRFTEFDKWTADYLKNKVYTFSQSTFDALVGDVADSLHQAYEHGLGINDAASELRKVFRGLREYRLRLIARTEINSAQNEGTQKTMEEYGVQHKQWLTARDSRVRGNKPTDKANHIKLHGEVVGINERFSNGLYIPGDRSGPIADWINCRCRIRPYIP
jgi:hypothetical protein